MLPFFAVLLLAAPASIADEDPTGTLMVNVTDLRSEEGKVRVALHTSEDTFPTKRKEALAVLIVTINGNQATARFPDIHLGDYAVAVYHDEDNNGRLNRSVIGIPKEGTAASRDPKPRMGPPRWKDCVFTLGPGETKMSMKIRY